MAGGGTVARQVGKTLQLASIKFSIDLMLLLPFSAVLISNNNSLIFKKENI